MKLTAVYPGTFDPITLGHVSVAKRASEIMQVVVAVAETGRARTAFSAEERVSMAREALRTCADIRVCSFNTLVTALAQQEGARFLIRGLRAISDFDYEFQMAAMNRHQLPELETLFLMPAERYHYLSSSLVREIAALGGDVSHFVPENVQAALLQRRQRASSSDTG